MSRDAGQRRYLLITIYQYLIQYIHTYLIFKPSKLITDELSTGRYNWYIFMYVIRSLFILRVLCILCFMFVRSKSCPSLVFVSTRMYIHTYLRRHIYTCTYIYMYICTYVRTLTSSLLIRYVYICRIRLKKVLNIIYLCEWVHMYVESLPNYY